MTVITRIAPSPTGRFHIGTARTALFNYLFARRFGGRFIIRIEDTDKERSKIEYETELLEGFAWLKLSADEVVWQSKRVDRHTALLRQLVADGKAYLSKEESKQVPGETAEVVRLVNPGKVIRFRDEVRGDISVDTTELGDFVIARSLEDPLYHFAVVVDDWDMRITHVIRGDDHIPNTPRQILIQEALGAPRPVYAHLPLILDEKRAKLSKRKGATSVMDYREEGILSEALVNYLAFLGWSPGDDREYFSLEELCAAFTIEGIQKNGASWNREKLLSVNQYWMRRLPDADFKKNLAAVSLDEAMVTKVIPLLKERVRTFGEARTMLAEELSFFFEKPSIAKETLLVKDPDNMLTSDVLEAFASATVTASGHLDAEAYKALLMPIAEKREAEGKGGRGQALWALRYALSGKERSPDPFTITSLLGKDESVQRLRAARMLANA